MRKPWQGWVGRIKINLFYYYKKIKNSFISPSPSPLPPERAKRKLKYWLWLIPNQVNL